MRKTILVVSAAVALLSIACAVHIYEPDYHCREGYYAHSSRGRSSCSSCHFAVVTIRDGGCWECH